MTTGLNKQEEFASRVFNSLPTLKEEEMKENGFHLELH